MDSQVGRDRPPRPSEFPLAGGVLTVWNGFHWESPWSYGHGVGAGRPDAPETPGDFGLYRDHLVGSDGLRRLVQVDTRFGENVG
jgi:hypothetical protein